MINLTIPFEYNDSMTLIKPSYNVDTNVLIELIQHQTSVMILKYMVLFFVIGLFVGYLSSYIIYKVYHK